jgi:hypothetical protein
VVFADFGGNLLDRAQTEAVSPAGQTVQMFHGSSAALLRTIVTTLADVDVDRIDGKVLVWIQAALQDPVLVDAGLYVLPPDVSTATLVPLGSLEPIGPPASSRGRRCPGATARACGRSAAARPPRARARGRAVDQREPA